MAMVFDYTGKCVLVTGAGRGIGKAIALTFADCGADVYIGNRNEKEGMQTVAEIEAMGRRGGFSRCDVSKAEDVEALVRDAVAFGGGKVDVIVNSAGIMKSEDMLTISDEDVQALMNINIMGTNHVFQSGMKQLISQKFGNIVAISSMAGRCNQSEHVQVYCATKAAVISLVQGAAKVGAPYGIRVNSVAPGIVRTEMWEPILDSMASGWHGTEGAKSQTMEQREDMWEQNLLGSTPLKRPQSCEDIAYATVFIAHDTYAREITGQTLSVDGGATMV